MLRKQSAKFGVIEANKDGKVLALHEKNANAPSLPCDPTKVYASRGSLEYQPGDAEAKYFLSEFCRFYYRRNRFTINDDFAHALYFLDGKSASDVMQQYTQADTIKKFLTDPGAPQTDIDVQQVTLEPMDKPPYRARVDFYRVEYEPADHSVLKKTLYTASFLYLFRDSVPNALIPVNPLGLTITYFRVDQAFTDAVNKGQP